MFTLGFTLGHNAGSHMVDFVAAATGLVLVALQIAYLPTLYSAYNRRETLVTLLESRAGAPAWGPELLIRHQLVGLIDNLPSLFAEWERWAADVAESHTSYPSLLYLRSPRARNSWVISLLAVMDAAAIAQAVDPDGAPIEARMMLRMGFTCLREIAQVTGIPFDPDPSPDDPILLPEHEFVTAYARLADIGYPATRTDEEAWSHFRGWRVNYEGVAYALASALHAPPARWSGPRTLFEAESLEPSRPTDRQPTAGGTPARRLRRTPDGWAGPGRQVWFQPAMTGCPRSQSSSLSDAGASTKYRPPAGLEADPASGQHPEHVGVGHTSHHSRGRPGSVRSPGRPSWRRRPPSPHQGHRPRTGPTRAVPPRSPGWSDRHRRRSPIRRDPDRRSTRHSRPASSQVLRALSNGLVRTAVNCWCASFGRRALDWASPSARRGRSVRPVWRPLRLHAVWPWRINRHRGVVGGHPDSGPLRTGGTQATPAIPPLASGVPGPNDNHGMSRADPALKQLSAP